MRRSVFKLATYDQNGLKMQEPGKNVENITAADFTAMGNVFHEDDPVFGVYFGEFKAYYLGSE